ncbi:hypothetical protein JCM3765_001686 [Sporobolomyces pararoseus]
MSQVRPTPEVLSLVAPPSFSWMRVLLSLLVLLVFLLIALFSPKSAKPISIKKARSGVRSVLLVGPLASGKTALFSRLVYGHAAQSFTSMEENEGVVKAKWGTSPPTEEKTEEKVEEEEAAVVLARPLHLVDIPGHPRLRTRSLAQFLPAADGIVFTIDAVSGFTGKNVRDAGEHLHVLLSLLSLLSTRRPAAAMPPVLILLTKSDLLSSSSSTPTKPKSPSLTLDRAKQSLARELERRRTASSAGMTSAGAKLEGLEAIPTGASNSSFFKSILSSIGLGSPTATTGVSESVEGLPSDEAELLANEDAFPFEGAFDWDKVENSLTEINWAVASSMDKTPEGLSKLWEWVEGDL